MDPFFRIELLPARQGDAIWIEYGNTSRTRRILIDAGPIDAYKDVESKLKTLPEGDKRVELVVITHVDNDHIEGMIRLFAEKRQKWLIAPEDIWFNGYRHMHEDGVLGGREGDFLSALLNRRAFGLWNKHFSNKAVNTQPGKPLPVVQLADGMKITLLSPSPPKLKNMAKKWIRDVDKHGLKPGDLDKAWDQLLSHTKLHPNDGILGGPGEIDEVLRKQLKTDQSAANGSSIAFLAEFEGKSCLFLGDSHASIIAKSIQKLIPPDQQRLKVDAVKVSHHGSRNNISKKLLELIDTRNYLVSTSGARYKHPNKPAINAIILSSLQDPVLWFNYKSDFTQPWEKTLKPGLRSYQTRYPLNKSGGISIEL